jgi:hypothetical protein
MPPGMIEVQGGGRPLRNRGPRTDTTYGPAGDVRTSMSRTPIDIGTPGDFFGDLKKFRRSEPASAPPPAPALQAQALRGGEGAAPAPRSTGPDPNTPIRRAANARFMMNQTGNWGDFINYADMPLGLSGVVDPGFHGGVTNWDTSNPMILGSRPYGKHAPSAPGQLHLGGDAGIPSADQAMALRGGNPNAGFSFLPQGEQARWDAILKNAYAPAPPRG